MDTIFRKPPLTRRTIPAKSGSTAIDGGQIKVDLPLDFVVSEHRVFVELSQTFNPAALPTLTDVRRMFSKVELASDKGTIYSGDFFQIYDHSRYTENQVAPQITLGATSLAAFPFELHHINDESRLDLLSALKTADHASLQLVLTLNPDNANMFLNGTSTGAAQVTVRVQGREYPALSNDQSIGHVHHYFKHLAERTGTAAAGEYDVNLKAGGKVRALFVHTFDTATGLPVNGVIDKFNLSIGGVERIKNERFSDVQVDGGKLRPFGVQAGVAVIEFGDDPSGWPEITGEMGEVKLMFTSLVGAPANWKVRVAQDWTVGFNKFDGL